MTKQHLFTKLQFIDFCESHGISYLFDFSNDMDLLRISVKTSGLFSTFTNVKDAFTFVQSLV